MQARFDGNRNKSRPNKAEMDRRDKWGHNKTWTNNNEKSTSPDKWLTTIDIIYLLPTPPKWLGSEKNNDDDEEKEDEDEDDNDNDDDDDDDDGEEG